MANLVGPSGGGTGGSSGVPALVITTEQQAVVALAVEVGFVMVLAVVADMGQGWGTAAVLVMIMAWLLFLMGNAEALKSKFAGVFP